MENEMQKDIAQNAQNKTGKGLPNQKEDVKNETVYLYNQG